MTSCGGCAIDGVERRVAGRRGGDLVAAPAQQRRHRRQDAGLVVDDQDACGHGVTPPRAMARVRAGTAMLKPAPRGATFSAQTRPPSAATRPRVIARPMPVPGHALPEQLAAIERLEQPLELVRLQARALVADLEPQTVGVGPAAHVDRAVAAHTARRSRAGARAPTRPAADRSRRRRRRARRRGRRARRARSRHARSPLRRSPPASSTRAAAAPCRRRCGPCRGSRRTAA